jgi:hypothetical protein
MRGHLPAHKARVVLEQVADPAAFDSMPVQRFMELFTL